jgi:hypothetical protein
MTCGSSMLAMIFTAPPHCSQDSISMPKTRLRRCAQVIAACFGHHTALPRACRATAAALGGQDLCSQAVIRCKHPVVARQIHPGARHQSGQAGQKIQRLEDHVRRTVPVRRLQGVANMALCREREPLDRHRWAGNVAAQPLECAPLIRPGRNPGVQRESRRLRHPLAAGRLPTGRQALQHERLAAPVRAERDAIGDRMPPQFGQCAVLISRVKCQMTALHVPHQQTFALQVPADPLADPLHAATGQNPRRLQLKATSFSA